MVFGGRSRQPTRATSARDMRAQPRARRRAGRARRAHASRCAARPRAERKIAVVLFNFPPNAGNAGTAAYLSVFASLLNTLTRAEGRGLHGRCARRRRRAARAHPRAATRQRFGTRRQRPCAHPGRRSCARARSWLAEIEAQWGPAPGRAAERRRVDLRARRALRQRLRRRAARLRLRGRPDAAAVRARLRADARVLAPSTAGCARISPPTPCCISARMARWSSCPASRPACPRACWPDRLIGDLPNFYLYASNNPSEGTDRQAPRRRRR